MFPSHRSHNSSTTLVHFKGTITEDEKGKYTGSDRILFLDTRERGSSFAFNLCEEQTIPGLDVALSKMREGESAIIICKPNYAFGDHGNPTVCFFLHFMHDVHLCYHIISAFNTKSFTYY